MGCSAKKKKKKFHHWAVLWASLIHSALGQALSLRSTLILSFHRHLAHFHTRVPPSNILYEFISRTLITKPNGTSDIDFEVPVFYRHICHNILTCFFSNLLRLKSKYFKRDWQVHGVHGAVTSKETWMSNIVIFLLDNAYHTSVHQQDSKWQVSQESYKCPAISAGWHLWHVCDKILHGINNTARVCA